MALYIGLAAVCAFVLGIIVSLLLCCLYYVCRKCCCAKDKDDYSVTKNGGYGNAQSTELDSKLDWK